MDIPATAHTRTLAFVGQNGAGKTSLVEALLHHTGMINTPGDLARGTTVCDYDPLEKTHQHSVKLAVTHFRHQDALVHLLDTPGLPDFMGQALCALDAVDTVAVVINAQNGIEITARRMMQWAETRQLCRLIVVNKMEGELQTLPQLLEELRAAFGKECLPVNLPAERGARVVDCFFNAEGQADFGSVAEAHRALVDQVVEVDEGLMTRYLEQGEVAPEALHAPFEAALRAGHIIPVCFVSARTGAGVAELADNIVRWLPSPAESNPPLFERWPSNAERRDAVPFAASPDAERHVLAHVFKVEMDPYVGKIAVFRVHQGTLVPNAALYVGESRKPVRVGQLFLLQGKQHIPIERAVPGTICALAKLEDVHFDSVLHDAPEDDHIHLRPLEFPPAVFGLSIRPRRRGDEHKLSEVLHRLEEEDPSLKVAYDASTHEEVMQGLGEIHLASVLEKMRQQYRLEVETHVPQVPYRETVTLPAEGHCRHRKQTGGAGQFGEVFLRIEPLPRGAGFEFVDEVKGGAIPASLIPAVEKGVRQVLASGASAGFPLQDVRVIVHDGKTHPVDSKEIAFVTAGRKAFLDAIARASPIVLEPIVGIALAIPETAIGDVSGELAARRGQITGQSSARAGMAQLSARAPLAELLDFPSRLKSLTAGQGSYTLTFSHHDVVPPAVQRKLTEAYRPREED